MFSFVASRKRPMWSPEMQAFRFIYQTVSQNFLGICVPFAVACVSGICMLRLYVLTVC